MSTAIQAVESIIQTSYIIIYQRIAKSLKCQKLHIEQQRDRSDANTASKDDIDILQHLVIQMNIWTIGRFYPMTETCKQNSLQNKADLQAFRIDLRKKTRFSHHSGAIYCPKIAFFMDYFVYLRLIPLLE